MVLESASSIRAYAIKFEYLQIYVWASPIVLVEYIAAVDAHEAAEYAP